MPTRIIRDGILTSDRVNLLSPNAELFYRRLMSVVDDYGRFPANTMLLRASCYPLKLDSVKEDSISKHLAECVGARLIVLYTVADKAYLELQDFGQRVQTKAKYPAPLGNPPELTVIHGGIPENTARGVVVVEGVVEGESAPAQKRKRHAKQPLPDGFGISERVRSWAAEKGHAQLELHLESFRAKCLAKGYEYADWDSAFMEAIRGDWAKIAAAPGEPRRQRRELGT